jgi:aconitate decarboxylase
MTKTHNGWDYKPEGVTTAQMNLAYCLSVMALEGDVSFDQFREEKLRDPRILDFIRRIEVIPDPELDALGQDYRHAIKCRIETVNGQAFDRRVNFAKGGTDNPMTLEDVRKKFFRLSTKVVSAEQAHELHEAIMGLERLRTVDELTRLLVGR